MSRINPTNLAKVIISPEIEDRVKLAQLWKDAQEQYEECGFYHYFKRIYKKNALAMSVEHRTFLAEFLHKVAIYVGPALHEPGKQCKYKYVTTPYPDEKGWSCEFCTACCERYKEPRQFSPQIPRWLCLQCMCTMCQSCKDRGEYYNRRRDYPRICPLSLNCKICQHTSSRDKAFLKLSDDEVELMKHGKDEPCKYAFTAYSNDGYESGFDCDYCGGCFNPDKDIGFPANTNRYMCFQCKIDICEKCWKEGIHLSYRNAAKEDRDSISEYCRPEIKCSQCEESKSYYAENPFFM